MKIKTSVIETEEGAKVFRAQLEKEHDGQVWYLDHFWDLHVDVPPSGKALESFMEKKWREDQEEKAKLLESRRRCDERERERALRAH